MSKHIRISCIYDLLVKIFTVFIILLFQNFQFINRDDAHVFNIRNVRFISIYYCV